VHARTRIDKNKGRFFPDSPFIFEEGSRKKLYAGMQFLSFESGRLASPPHAPEGMTGLVTCPINQK